MASTSRKPLLSRAQSLHNLDSPSKSRSSSKRARSPEPLQLPNDTHISKRHRTVEAVAAKVDDKERRRADRESVWRAKYLEHFPRWSFYFDLDVLDPDVSSTRKRLEAKVRHLGAVSFGIAFTRRPNLTRVRVYRVSKTFTRIKSLILSQSSSRQPKNLPRTRRITRRNF